MLEHTDRRGSQGEHTHKCREEVTYSFQNLYHGIAKSPRMADVTVNPQSKKQRQRQSTTNACRPAPIDGRPKSISKKRASSCAPLLSIDSACHTCSYVSSRRARSGAEAFLCKSCLRIRLCSSHRELPSFSPPHVKTHALFTSDDWCVQ